MPKARAWPSLVTPTFWSQPALKKSHPHGCVGKARAGSRPNMACYPARHTHVGAAKRPLASNRAALKKSSLIGRGLRSVVDLVALGERQITIDCDVIQADGGTRTAALTGAWVALKQATLYMKQEGLITGEPIRAQVAAVSCGIYKDLPVLDLDYPEDSNAEADANFVLADGLGLVEVQATGEERPFTEDELQSLLGLAKVGCGHLFAAQRTALGL
jgi:ribonuclease PH